MKKVLALLLSGLFLCGCGMGGGDTAASSGGTPAGGGAQTGPTAQTGPAQAFTLSLVNTVKATARTIDGVDQTATDVRVVITKFEKKPTPVPVFDDEGNYTGTTTLVDLDTEVYKDIQDVPYSSTVTVGIPAGTGYTIDVITSKLEAGDNKSIIKYGKGTNISVVAGGSASIDMLDLNSILAFTVPASVVSKGKFEVTLNNALPLDPRYKMTMTYNSDAPVEVSTLTTKCSFTAPTTSTASTSVVMRGEFAINKSFLKKGETTAKWTRTFPNADYSEDGSIPVTPLVDVTVPIN